MKSAIEQQRQQHFVYEWRKQNDRESKEGLSGWVGCLWKYENNDSKKKRMQTYIYLNFY